MTEAATLDAPARLGRGRPRPQETLDRDEKVFVAIIEPKTRREIAAETGIDVKLVYLSLCRLRRAGRIDHVREHIRADNAHKWIRI